MLIIRNPTNVFDTDEIQRGTLIYAKHKSWSVGEQHQTRQTVKNLQRKSSLTLAQKVRT